MEPKSNFFIFIFVLIIIILFIIFSVHHSTRPKTSSNEVDDISLEDEIITLFELNAGLLGEKESPKVVTFAFGIAKFRLNETNKILRYDITFINIVDVVEISVEQPNGVLVKVLTKNVINDKVMTVLGTWTSDDEETPLTDKIITELINNKLFLNVKTKKHINGEIRGLICHDGFPL